MREEIGNIWEKYYGDKHCLIIIPTNCCQNNQGHAVMGRGLALQAKERFPLVSRSLAEKMDAYGNDRVHLLALYRMVAFPTKYHYNEDSKIVLIERGVQQLIQIIPQCFVGTIYLPHLGCGLGKLNWERQVKPVLDAWLDDRFIALYDELTERGYNGR